MNDVDLAIEVAESLSYQSVKLRPKRAAPAFSAGLTVGRLGSATVALAHYDCDTVGSVDGDDVSYQAVVPLQGEFEFGVHSTSILATPETAGIVGPLGTNTFEARGMEHLLIFKFDRKPLEVELGRMLGRDSLGPLIFRPTIDLRSGRGAEWLHMAQLVVAALKSDQGLLFNPLLGAHLANALTNGLLLCSDHKFRERLDAPGQPMTPAAIKRAAEFIEANAQDPLSLPKIAASVGASVRTLQRGFADHYATTPIQYLARIRLEKAHHDLVTGNPMSVSVTDIASRWGFANPGRFAGTYRARYGVSPSTTLRAG